MNDDDDELIFGGEDDCWHTIIAGITKTEVQCTGCLRIWPRRPDFVADYGMEYACLDEDGEQSQSVGAAS